jgi:folate-binding protein YgfZ
MTLTPTQAQQYRALRDGAGLVERPTRARVQVSGRNRLDLLHRMTSQDLKSLRPGEGRSAVLLNDKGRIVDHLNVFALDEEVRVLCAREDASPALAHLRRYTLRDDFRPQDVTGSTALFQVYGPRAAEALRAAGVGTGSGSGGGNPGATGGEASGATARALSVQRLGENEVLLEIDGPCASSLALWVPAERAEAWRRRLLESGATASLRSIGPEAYEAVRIEAGFPAWGSELSEEVNPLEAGLDASIHWNKGCYIGQEVIARLDTYHKVQRHLVGIRFAAGVPPPPPRSAILAGGEAAGFVTSATLSPALGASIALAYLRTGHAAPGTEVQVQLRADESGVPATVASLPFVR